MPDWFDELAVLLRIPSVSADPAHADDVRRAGEWVCDFIREAGGTAEIVEVDTPSGAQASQPLAIGEIRASDGADGAPTVLCYGHFDVQPPDPLELWESPPFQPEIRGEYLFGRGVADDKGQLYLMLSAARSLARAGELPVNVRFVCDGEEETGGQSVLTYLASDAGGADAAVIFDTGMIARDRPAFDLATRGMAYFHLTLRTGARDLHSGAYGGAALNAVQALCELLASLAPRDGGVLPEPLREGIRAPTPEELESWRALPAGAEELALADVAPRDADAARDYHLRTLAEPAFDVNGILGGSPTLEKTVLPVQAQANVSLRLAPGQDPDTIAGALRTMLLDATPEGATLEIELLSTARPGIVDPDSRVIELGLGAFERALGVRPLLVRSGGTLPIVSALADRGIPTIITGFSLPDANIHSPNERLLVDYVDRGIAAARALFTELGSL